jgi:hypothetical protein
MSFQPGKEASVTVNGKVWRLGRLDVDAIDEFMAWVREQVGDPFELVERFMGKIPQEESVRQLREAEEVAKQLKALSVQTPLAQQYVSTARGSAKLFQILLRTHHPDATESQAFLVAQALGEEGARKALQKAEGEFPRGNPQPGQATPDLALLTEKDSTAG